MFSHRFHLAVIAFLFVFAALLEIVRRWFLSPASAAWQGADVAGQHMITAVSRLLLAIILLFLVVGLALVLRARHRLHKLRSASPRTTHVDAWAESGRRLRTPPGES